MPRTDISLWTPAGDAIDPADVTIALTAINATDDAQFVAAEGVLLFLQSNATGPTATIKTIPDPGWGRDDDLVITAVASGEWWIAGPFPSKAFVQTDGNIYIDVTGTGDAWYAAAIYVGRSGPGAAPATLTQGSRTLVTPAAAPGYRLPSTGLELTLTACTGGAGAGAEFAATGRDLVLIQRSSGGSETLKIKGVANAGYGRTEDFSTTDWAAGTTNLHVLGPVGIDGYRQTDNKIYVESQTTGFNCAVVTLPR